MRGEPYDGEIPYPVICILRMAGGQQLDIWALPVHIAKTVEMLRQEMILHKLM